MGGKGKWRFQPDRWATGGTDGPSRTRATDQARLLSLGTPYLHLVDAVGIADEAGAIVTSNEPFCRILGFTRDQLVGRHVWTLLSPAGRMPVGDAMAATAGTSGPWSGYVTFRRGDGSDRIVHLSVTPLEAEGKRFGYVFVLHDATPLVQHVVGNEVGSPVEAGLVRAHEMGVAVFTRLIRAVARIAEVRDPDIEGHLERMQHLVRWLVGSHEACCTWSPQEREGVALLSMLHDLGKVAIPEGILFKPAPLTPEERKLMERHTVVGEELIRRHLEIPGLESWIARAAEIARSHHERWDGTGYPDGLAGDAIPLAARIVAVVDVLDALLSRRAYKEPWPWERAVAYIQEQQGRQFDPALVKTFLKVAGAIRGYYASRGLPSLPLPPRREEARATSP